MFTSGTTGTSKGGLLQAAQAYVKAVKKNEDEVHRLLGVLPLHHVTGFTIPFFSAEVILAAMRRTHSTILPNNRDLSGTAERQLTKSLYEAVATLE